MFTKAYGFIYPHSMRGRINEVSGVFRPTFIQDDRPVTPMGEPRMPLAVQTIRSFRQVIVGEGSQILGLPKMHGATFGVIGDPMLLTFKKAFTEDEAFLGNAHVLGPVLLDWLEEMADSHKLLGQDIHGLRTIWEVIRLVPIQRKPSDALRKTVELLVAEGPTRRN